MAWSFVLDGANITDIALDKSWTRRLNRPSMGKCRCPGHLISVNAGTSKLKIYDGAVLKFHGVVWRIDDSGEEDDTYTEFTAFDPMIYWPMKPVRDDQGVVFPNLESTAPQTIFEKYGDGPAIMSRIIQNSQFFDASMGIQVGSVAFGGMNLHARPTDWPLTVEDARRLLTETGRLDIVMQPTESGGNMATMNLYNGDYGSDLSGSASFQYQAGAYNVKSVKRSQDMSTVCNKLWYLGGPKQDDGQHFCWSITKDDPCLDTYPEWAAIKSVMLASRTTYGELVEFRILDAFGEASGCPEPVNEPVPGVCSAAPGSTRRLYWNQYINETLIRAVPRTLVTVTPIKGISPSFDAGDLVGVQAGARLRGGFAGAQRVYEFTVNVDKEGVAELGQLITSADQE
jgi:hypothetical protein